MFTFIFCSSGPPCKRTFSNCSKSQRGALASCYAAVINVEGFRFRLTLLMATKSEYPFFRDQRRRHHSVPPTATFPNNHNTHTGRVANLLSFCLSSIAWHVPLNVLLSLPECSSLSPFIILIKATVTGVGLIIDWTQTKLVTTLVS